MPSSRERGEEDSKIQSLDFLTSPSLCLSRSHLSSSLYHLLSYPSLCSLHSRLLIPVTFEHRDKSTEVSEPHRRSRCRKNESATESQSLSSSLLSRGQPLAIRFRT